MEDQTNEAEPKTTLEEATGVPGSQNPNTHVNEAGVEKHDGQEELEEQTAEAGSDEAAEDE